MFSIRQKGDRGGSLNGRGKGRQGFYTFDPQTVSILMRDLKHGASTPAGVGSVISMCVCVFGCVNVCISGAVIR